MNVGPILYFLDYLWQNYLYYFWEIFRSWWWILAPFVLWKPFSFLYLWWRSEAWTKKQRMILLEIRLPREILKPIRAMEQVMASLHRAVYTSPDWWEKWIEGQVPLSISFEIASIGGETHFYIRAHSSFRDAIEASIYSQYPQVEINEVEDYTKYVPQDIPNKDWALWGADYCLARDDHFPIKTYPKFEVETIKEEEKKVDPVAVLLEALAKVKPGEQIWIQIIATPLRGPLAEAWVKKGEEIRDRLVRRPLPSPPKPLLQEAVEVLISGPPSPKPEKEEIFPTEMRLTPGEKEIVARLEEKISKPIFLVNIRAIYLGKRKVWFKPNFRLLHSYFNSYTTTNLNAFSTLRKTFPKIRKSWFLPLNLLIPRREYLRCRRLFRNYVRRNSPFFPRKGGTFILNTEELASLYHFPSEEVAPAPGVIRVEAKKKGVSFQLPTE